jgi:hypothetical protein
MVRNWLQLLIIPFAPVVISFVFTVQQHARQRKLYAGKIRHSPIGLRLLYTGAG